MDAQAALRPSRGDGNPNTPALLTVPHCSAIAERAAKAAEADAVAEVVAGAAVAGLRPHRAAGAGRLLISYPEQERWLEELRLEAIRTRCC